MAKTKAQYQANFREKNKDRFKRLDVLLPVSVFNQFQENAQNKGLTKAAYIELLMNSGKSGRTELFTDSLPCSNEPILEPNKVYTYSFATGKREIKTDGKTHKYREQKAGVKRFSTWQECQRHNITGDKESGLYINTPSGSHLLELKKGK